MKFFDAFSGYGGFHLGIKRAIPDAECIGNSEINKYAQAVYKYHFGGNNVDSIERGADGQSESDATQSGQTRPGLESTPRQDADAENGSTGQLHTIKSQGVLNYGDITTIAPDELPDFDLFCGGFPCQAFSIAGKRLGFDDTRGTLFYEIARIIKTKRPAYLLLENVKGLLSHDSGRTFETILRTLAELGYDLEWQVLNAKNFGVPQNRERVFIVGYLGGIGRRQIFPIRKDDQIHHEQNEADPGRPQAEISTTLKAAGNIQAADTFIVHNVYGGFKEKEVREFHDISPTIRTPQGGGHLPSLVTGTKIRRLTPTECERLMGLPDGWTKMGEFVGGGLTRNVGQPAIQIMRKRSRGQCSRRNN